VTAADCARRGGDDARQRRPSPLDKWPFLRDFDAVIAALERAAVQKR
jgi:hypothetical protein